MGHPDAFGNLWPCPAMTTAMPFWHAMVSLSEHQNVQHPPVVLEDTHPRPPTGCSDKHNECVGHRDRVQGPPSALCVACADTSTQSSQLLIAQRRGLQSRRTAELVTVVWVGQKAVHGGCWWIANQPTWV